MEGHLLMSRKELERHRVMSQVGKGQLTLKKAAQLLGVCYRQAIRIHQRYLAEGVRGLVHRNRGRPSNRRYSEAFRRKVISRYESRYKDLEIGPTLLSEKLAGENLVVDHETLRRWLIQEAYWQKRRKRHKHRSRREPRHHFGELVQMDGSHHAWFGPDRSNTCLMQMVDDATGMTVAYMAEQETTESAMRALWLWIERYGIPQALYTDKKSVFVTDREPTLDEQLAGQRPLTAFGRACKKLGIEIIEANSPQAKGRVERKHGLLQDRLVKELALAGIKSIAAVNRLLQRGFMDGLNAKFAREPLAPQNFHRPLPKATHLADILCFEQTRVLGNDWTIRYHNRYYQVASTNRPLPRPKDKILMRWRLDGQLSLLYRDTPLEFVSLTPRQFERRNAAGKSLAAPKTPPTTAKKARCWQPNCTLMFCQTDDDRS